MIHLGIDLGTTYSLVAHVGAQGIPSLFPDFNDANEFRTPSVVHIGNRGCLVGAVLEELLMEEPSLPVARFAKLALANGVPFYADHLGRNWTAEGISALLVRKLLRDVSAFSAEEVGAAVITVPASFNDAKRRATRMAAHLGGLPAAKLAEEPVAAAVYHGVAEGGRDQTLLVYDFGGGTFDATVLQSSREGLFVVCTDGVAVGGKDIDQRIADEVRREFHRRHPVVAQDDLATRNALLKFATDTKLQLAKPGLAQVRRTMIAAGQVLDFTMTRSQFDKLADPLIDRTLEVCERALATASLSWSMVDKVLLVGGSSLLPSILERLRRRSGLAADRFICRQPHQSVAYGAALLAAIDSDKATNGGHAVVRQVASFDLGIRVLDKASSRPRVQVVIPRNAPLPAQNTATFYTTRADQSRIVVEVVQSRGDEPENSLGSFSFGPIKRTALNYPVEISFKYDVEGIVTVTARDPATNEVMERLLGSNETLPGLLSQHGWLSEMNINAW